METPRSPDASGREMRWFLRFQAAHVDGMAEGPI